MAKYYYARLTADGIKRDIRVLAKTTADAQKQIKSMFSKISWNKVPVAGSGKNGAAPPNWFNG
ncbi:MAG: hypothetical protein F4Y89_11435 [Gammaproteobacteria bacterium]|nr:hypothetical protein [Gammaproteobacteria bacterium]MYG97514.1 hypothetical protein [Gammaproteobacteria bacterium]